MKLRDNFCRMFASQFLYLIGYVLLCMWINAVRGIPVWIGAIMGLVIYILTIFLFFILCAVCFKISDKIHPPKPWEEGYKSKFDE